jgi:Transposase
MVLPLAADGIRHGVREGAMRLCVGDDWAEEHHDIEVMDEAGQVLARRRLPEGVAGIGQLHELIGRFVPADGDAEVQVGIETDRGPWVTALIAAGYVVFPVNPLQVSASCTDASRPGPLRRGHRLGPPGKHPSI